MSSPCFNYETQVPKVQKTPVFQNLDHYAIPMSLRICNPDEFHSLLNLKHCKLDGIILDGWRNKLTDRHPTARYKTSQTDIIRRIQFYCYYFNLHCVTGLLHELTVDGQHMKVTKTTSTVLHFNTFVKQQSIWINIGVSMQIIMRIRIEKHTHPNYFPPPFFYPNPFRMRQY